MSDSMTPVFIFAVCQVGAEAALKKEMAREHPQFKFAYSRPGFVTFKLVPADSFEDLQPSFELKSVFARQYGLSIGQSDAKKAIETARKFAKTGNKIRLHVFERDQFVPGDEPLGFTAGFLSKKGLEDLQREAGNEFSILFYDQPVAEDGDLVLDYIAIGENEFWLGYHQHTPLKSPFPGGRPTLTPDPTAPSRAYYKLDEAIQWSGVSFSKEDTAVEIGSAPGGSCYLLLKNGLKTVIGIDPGQMSPLLSNFSNFFHIQKPVNSVLREELPESIQWLLLDLNVHPNVSLFAVDRLASRMKDSLLGVFLTVKLNKWSLADEIPYMLKHVRAMGMVRVRATQLASNRQEIMVFGLTRKGLARSPRSLIG